MRHKFNRLNHQLTLNEKFLIVSLFFCFVFTFFPWFKKEMTNAQDSFLAYNGIGAIMGWFFAFFIIFALGSILISTTNHVVAGFFKRNYWIYLFLTGEALFLLILTSLVYTSYAMQFSQAGLGYGLILAIISNIIALFSSHFFYLQEKKNSLKKKLVTQMQANVHLEPDNIKPKTNNKNLHHDDIEDHQMTLSDYVDN